MAVRDQHGLTDSGARAGRHRKTGRTVLVTGGAGFIGSTFIHTLLARRPEWRVVNLDALTYAGNLENLEAIRDHPNYTFVHGDISRVDDVRRAFDAAAGGQVTVAHLAAESHVDRSIISGLPFVKTNLLGTQVLIDVSRERGVERFVHVSTDEVYGSMQPDECATEESRLAPNSPYSASKAGGDLLVRAAVRTHGFPACIVRGCNNYGPRQFPEKLIPLTIANAREEKPLPVYGDGLHVREWIHAVDFCEAIIRVLEDGRTGEIYNIGSGQRLTNLEVVRLVVKALRKQESLITFVDDRPGHDRRYALDATRIERELGWRPRFTFEEALLETIRWYGENADWLDRVRSGAYQDYYRKQYRTVVS